ncbi:hypothetical protein NDN08_000377 [Rhodosorus marinus]|uniref:Peptidase S9 prolyl oligopeptidase catalytic domain-containing protein n=1 Tax=Rhodosorus marinus TaxID=101924 RepID=A0AAV8UMR8_9RHOD|nr:hypothetical protein NDN08_000377 [Rhodosorus marinus]
MGSAELPRRETVEAVSRTNSKVLSLYSIWDRIVGFLRALVFLLRLMLDIYGGVNCRSEEIGDVKAMVYTPFFGKPCGVILVLPGLSPSGEDDIRVAQLSKALAGSGYVAIVPSSKRYRNIEISKVQIDDLVSFSEAVERRQDICPDGELSVISVCISAGFALIAATKHFYRSLLCIGAYGNAENVVMVHMLGDQEDDYGRNSMFYNFYDLYQGEDPEMRELFYARITDNHNETHSIHTELLKKKMQLYPNAAEKYDKLMFDEEMRRKVVENLWPKVKARMSYLSPENHVSKIMTNLTVFVHGLDDDVVAPGESLALYEKFVAANQPASVDTSPLLGHANKQIPIPDLEFFRNVFNLYRAFASFLTLASGPVPQKGRE